MRNWRQRRCWWWWRSLSCDWANWKDGSDRDCTRMGETGTVGPHVLAVPPPPPPPSLIIGPYGWPSTATCPSGYTSITSWEQCKSASETLGISHFRGKPSDNMFPVNTIQGCTAVCTGVYGRATQPPSACSSANFKWSHYGSQICKLVPPEPDCGLLGHKCNGAVILGQAAWNAFSGFF